METPGLRVWLDVGRLVELPGDGDASDRLVGELFEGAGRKVEVVLRAAVALVLDLGGHGLPAV